MEFKEFTCAKDDDGKRLDKVIRHIIDQSALALIYKSIRKGLVKINGKNYKPESRIAQGDVISIAAFLLEESTGNDKEPQNIDQINSQIDKIRVFENEHILILNKASGINVHSSTKEDVSLQTLVEKYYKLNFANQSLTFVPGPLHRIDRFTSGIVCFAKSTQCAHWFTAAMKDHKIKKQYAAFVQGDAMSIAPSQTWKDYLVKPEENEVSGAFHTVKVYAEDDKERPKDSKLCITTIIPQKSVVLGNSTATLCHFDIETGRQHQIRAQSAFHGFPLLGDTAYGAKKIQENDGHFYLCAYELELPQNELGIPQNITIALPKVYDI